jgi:hypothetical protein
MFGVLALSSPAILRAGRKSSSMSSRTFGTDSEFAIRSSQQNNNNFRMFSIKRLFQFSIYRCSLHFSPPGAEITQNTSFVYMENEKYIYWYKINKELN